MKLKYIFTALVASLSLAVGCEEDIERHLDEVKVSSSYVAIPAEGGSQTITVNAEDAWSFGEIPDWLTVSPASGNAGETEVTFTAGAATSTNEVMLYLSCSGKSQIINVLQMTEKVELPISTCAEVNNGQDGVTYRIKGTVTSITSTTYGNMYVDDGTDVVYVYGTLDASGAEKNFSSLEISVGDVVTVEGPRTTYSGTIELKNVSVINIEKSLIKVDSLTVKTAESEEFELYSENLPVAGAEVKAYLTVKGSGVSVVVPDAAKSWISVKSIETGDNATTVMFDIAANEGGDRSATLAFSTVSGGVTYSAQSELAQKGAIIETTIDKVLAAADGTTQYKVTGYIRQVTNDKYGNYYIKDATGEILVYGTLDASGASGKFSSLGISEGDIVTVVGPKVSFNGAAQMKNVTVESHIKVTDISLADFRNLSDDKTKYYRISGKVAKSTEDKTQFDLEKYGNFALTDGTTEVYVYGVRTGWGGSKGKFGTLGVKEGDNLTIVCYKTSWGTLVEADGCFYVSHVSNVAGLITITVDGLPGKYPTEETTVTLAGIDSYIINVANYGNGIQMKKGGSYIANKSAINGIVSIKVTVADGKTYNPDNISLYAGTSAKPEGDAITGTSDATSTTFDLSSGNYTYFTLKNASSSAVYLSKIEITCKK